MVPATLYTMSATRSTGETEASTIRVVVVDDHPLVLKGIKSALSRVVGLSVVAEATDGDDALRAVIDHKPDLLILDINLPGLPSEQVVLLGHQQHPELKTLILSAYDDEAYLRRFSQLPISGYMLKDEAPEGLAQAVRAIHQGAIWYSHSVAQRILAMNRLDRELGSSLFSDREKELLRLLTTGLSNQGVAGRLNLARQTVSNLFSNIYQKMGVSNRIQAAIWVRENQLRSGLHPRPVNGTSTLD